MRLLLYTIFFCCYLLTACNSNHSAATIQLPGRMIQQPPPDSIPARYTSLKESISRQQAAMAAAGAPPEAVRPYLFRTINDSLFYYWYGTPWDYNGITEMPNTGRIACGYFVTTVLRDAGIPIGRIKMAQAASSVLIQSVCARGSIRHFSRVEDLSAYLNTLQDSSLLILGLDNHVGFVTHLRGANYFIHASCVGRRSVEEEVLAESGPIISSKSFMIGNLLANEAILRQWLKK